MATSMEGQPSGDAPASMFEAVVAEDYDSLVKLFAVNARNSVASYLSMKSRWGHRSEKYTNSEEKLDEFLQQLSDSSGHALSPISASRVDDDNSYYVLLQELAGIISEEDKKVPAPPAPESSPRVSKEADRLIWEASAVLSDSRPPSNFCVYTRSGSKTPPKGSENSPPIFDGSVANSTPPPLAGNTAGASGGAGTVLHLACAMDQPLILAFLLGMGADGRASHTAFRRLMIHEAACNGSIQCLTLLLEMGQKYAKVMESEQQREESVIPFFPESLELPSASSLLGPSAQPARSLPPISMNVRNFRRSGKIPEPRKGSCLSLIRQFISLSQSVREGQLTSLQAARSLWNNSFLRETTRVSLIRSCAFKRDRPVMRCADGHGNTPLHWAAFKNERACLALLLKFNADPNARAHPSGWTPLHDAAYSNSSESIDLLVDMGAEVDARANSGATPLCFAAQEDAGDAAHLLLLRGANLTARCAGSPQEDGSIRLPIQHPHSRFSGYTPLHYCAHYNAHRASRVLLAHRGAKAAMETPDLSGRFPIHVAVARGSSDVLRELLHAGARVDIPPTLDGASPRPETTPNAFFALPDALVTRRPPSPEEPGTPNRNRPRSRSSSTSPVTSPVLKSMIPQQPISSSKPWNCLTQQAIDECKELITKAEQSWSPDRHLLFTPHDRKAVMELLRVGKRLEQQGVLFVDLWPLVLSFCGRGWFDVESVKPRAIDFCDRSVEVSDESESIVDNTDDASSMDEDDNDYLALPTLSA